MIAATVARRMLEESGYRPPRIEDELHTFRYDPEGFIRRFLKWTPWRGENAETPGQCDVLDQYVLALKQLHDKRDLDRGRKTADELEHWTPGTRIKSVLRIEAGHTVGKTKLGSGIVNHFFSCFPSIIYTFAPTWTQIHDLLWKEIKVDRLGTNLPGRTLDVGITAGPGRFATGRATSNNQGRGTERVQGQHGEYLMFVLDEAEGIDKYVFDAIESMISGGIALVLMLANPRTRVSEFYRARKRSDAANFRVSCLNHPNVRTGKEIVPNAVKRDYVLNMLEKHASIVAEHNRDQNTFTLDWDALVGGTMRPAGTIFLPDSEFLFRVLGIPPAQNAERTIIPLNRVEDAIARDATPTPSNTRVAYLGVDVARYGNDYGTIYTRHAGLAQRADQLYHADTGEYTAKVLAACEAVAAAGAETVSIRIDGTGGFGAGLIDALKNHATLHRTFGNVKVHEVQFGSRPFDTTKYADLVTEMYAETAETLTAVALRHPGPELLADLTEREFDFVNRGGESVKRLEPKEKFKSDPNKGAGRSPDDGDGLVLALAPEHLFAVRARTRRSHSHSMFAG